MLQRLCTYGSTQGILLLLHHMCSPQRAASKEKIDTAGAFSPPFYGFLSLKERFSRSRAATCVWASERQP